MRTGRSARAHLWRRAATTALRLAETHATMMGSMVGPSRSLIFASLMVLAGCASFSGDTSTTTSGDAGADAAVADASRRALDGGGSFEGCAPTAMGAPLRCSTTMKDDSGAATLKTTLPWTPVVGDTVLVFVGTNDNDPTVATLGATKAEVVPRGNSHVSLSLLVFPVTSETSRELVVEIQVPRRTDAIPRTVAIVTEWADLGPWTETMKSDYAEGLTSDEVITTAPLQLGSGDWLTLAVGGVQTEVKAPSDGYTEVGAVLTGYTGLTVAAKPVSGPSSPKTSWLQTSPPNNWNTFQVGFPRH